MKKIIAIFFLFLYLYNTCGYMAWYACARQQARQQAREYVRRNLAAHGNTVTFSSLDPLHWQSDDEFTYHGHLYDVVKTERRDGRIYYSCISDEKEDALITQANSITAGNSAEHGARATVKYTLTEHEPQPALYIPAPRATYTVAGAAPGFPVSAAHTGTPTPPPRTI